MSFNLLRILVGIFLCFVLAGCSFSLSPGPDGSCEPKDWVRPAQQEVNQLLPEGFTLIDSGPWNSGCGYPDMPGIGFRVNESSQTVVQKIINQAENSGWSVQNGTTCLRKTINGIESSLYFYDSSFLVADNPPDEPVDLHVSTKERCLD